MTYSRIICFMVSRRALVALVPLLFSLLTATGQQRVCIAFYNVENLNDTIPSRFYDDGDFTPTGKYRWDTERYGRKLSNISRVIGDMDPCILGLAEVENEEVVRDLVMALREDYNYIHRTSGDSRGMDLALLYKGDRFIPASVRLLASTASREFLLIKGELLGEEVSILLCHLPSKANRRAYRESAMEALARTADSLVKHDPSRKLIVMGDFNADPSEKVFRSAFGPVNGGFHTRSMFYGAVNGPLSGGFGSYAYGNRWYLFDNILLSFGFVYGEGLGFGSGGVFVREYMLTNAPSDAINRGRKGYPFRTVTAAAYTGGFSDHLPVFAILLR